MKDGFINTTESYIGTPTQPFKGNPYCQTCNGNGWYWKTPEPPIGSEIIGLLVPKITKCPCVKNRYIPYIK